MPLFWNDFTSHQPFTSISNIHELILLMFIHHFRIMYCLCLFFVEFLLFLCFPFHFLYRFPSMWLLLEHKSILFLGFVLIMSKWAETKIETNFTNNKIYFRYQLQVVRMFIAVVTIFAICWLPYHMFYVYAYHQPHITSTNVTPHLFLTFYWLAMSNSMVNPIIYYWMNRRFRHYFQRILCFCCFRLWKADDTLTQQNSLSFERKPRLCK